MVKKRTLQYFFLLVSLLPATPSSAGSSDFTYTIPARLEGVKHPAVSLNGKWEMKFSSKSRWIPIQVPGEVAMQGYAIEHDKPFLCRKTIAIPADYAGKRIILRFDGVYSRAKLSINGRFVRTHNGGFTRWETDVTSYVKVGKKNEIQLEITDCKDDISYASGYAHHPIGGILRDVTLFAVDASPVVDFHVETRFDSLYENANLRLAYNYAGTSRTKMQWQLKDAQGRAVCLPKNSDVLHKGENEISLAVEKPFKWDAEHPYLYTLEVSVQQDGKTISEFSKHIGFREIKVDGNRLLVNGQPVKLRGACRHDLHPTLGRSTTRELDSLDVVLFKQANMNFVRTSHYPPTERFLEFCDRYGIYVESETAVCFVNTYRQKNYAPGNSENDSAYTSQYLGQCEEMVKNFRSHPSVIMWSIGNESNYGSNFQRCWDWVKAADTTRPVIFSYPGSAKEQGKKIYDILSMHYQDVYGNLGQWGMTTQNFQGHGIPALFDEWAHPACYTYATLQEDPNIREFWGQSLDMMWSGLFKSAGGLGGAIWGYVDDIFFLPQPKVGTAWWKEFAHTAKPLDYEGKCVGYGEWGIVDVWRRKKPEFWSTKKAYSPVRLLSGRNLSYVSGQRLTMSVYNRFDHTSLNEVKATYTYNGAERPIALDAVAPHQKGILTIPAEDWKEGEELLVKFCASDGSVIDSYRFTLGEAPVSYPAPMGGETLEIVDRDSMLVVTGDGFEIPFSKTTGLIHNARAGNEVMIEKGPLLGAYINLNHLTGAEVRRMANRFIVSDSDWKKTSLRCEKRHGDVLVLISGTYQDVAVDYQIKITPSGDISVDYQTKNLPNGYLRETGLTFYLPDVYESVEWKRRGYWDSYPEGAFAGNEGNTPLFLSKQAKYGQKPMQPWQDDTHDYYYWADKGANCKKPLTQKAKGMKENIYFYSLSTCGKHRLSVVSPDASVACRLGKRSDEQMMLRVNNRWDYPEIAWGNYCKTIEALPCYGHVVLRLGK